MKDRHVRQEKQNRQSLIGHVFSLPFKIIGLIFVGLLFSIIIEWVGMTFLWKSEGANHSKVMLRQEISYLRADFGEWINGVKPSTYALSLQKSSHTYMLNNLKLKKLITFAKQHGRWAYQYLIAMIYTTETFIVRLLVATLSLPAFLIIGIVGVIEGLVQRDLRRFGGGIEHAFVYHMIKRNLRWPVYLSWVLYLSMPISVHPNWVFVPAALSFGGGLMLMTSTFKKYL